MPREISVSLLEFALDIYRAPDRIYNTGKLSQNIVTLGIHNPTIMPLDKIRYHLAVGIDCADGGLFIIRHQTTVPLYVSAKDGGEFPLGPFLGHGITSINTKAPNGHKIPLEAFFLSPSGKGFSFHTPEG
jgi:hypothetical protein